MVLVENNVSSYRHLHGPLHKHYRQFTYQWVTVNRHILCVSLCVTNPYRYQYRAKCACEWYLSFLWVQANCPTVTVIPLTLNRHLHAHLTALSILITNTWLLSSLTHPMHGPPPVPTYIYTGCYTDWVWTLVTTISCRLCQSIGSLTCPFAGGVTAGACI